MNITTWMPLSSSPQSAAKTHGLLWQEVSNVSLSLFVTDFASCYCCSQQACRSRGYQGPPQILADPLTLSQRGILCPPHYYWPPGFSDLPTALLTVVQSHPPLVIGFCLWRFMADYGVFFPHTSPDHANISTCVLYYWGWGGRVQHTGVVSVP